METKKYRIKTEKELIEEFGVDFRANNFGGWAHGDMDDMLGKVYTEDEVHFYEDHYCIGRSYFSFNTEYIEEYSKKDNTENTSYRGQEWITFSDKILHHIENYTVPQYGDYPDDQACTWSAKDCMLTIGRYVSRFGQNSRTGQEELDLMKIAHYACLASTKLDIPEEETITITLKEYNELLEKSKGE